MRKKNWLKTIMVLGATCMVSCYAAASTTMVQGTIRNDTAYPMKLTWPSMINKCFITPPQQNPLPAKSSTNFTFNLTGDCLAQYKSLEKNSNVGDKVSCSFPVFIEFAGETTQKPPAYISGSFHFSPAFQGCAISDPCDLVKASGSKAEILPNPDNICTVQFTIAQS